MLRNRCHLVLKWHSVFSIKIGITSNSIFTCGVSLGAWVLITSSFFIQNVDMLWVHVVFGNFVLHLLLEHSAEIVFNFVVCVLDKDIINCFSVCCWSNFSVLWLLLVTSENCCPHPSRKTKIVAVRHISWEISLLSGAHLLPSNLCF